MTHPLFSQARPDTASALPPSRALRVAVAASLLLGGIAPGQLSWAASTDISNSPLINATVSVKPNLMFILDNSGSMASDYLPDDTGERDRYSVWSSQCNGAAFNPNDTTSPYTLPKTPDGRNYPNQSLTAAWPDGFQPTLSDSTSVTVSLNTDTPDPEATSPVTVSGTVTVKRGNLFLEEGDAVVVYESGDDTHWMVGTVIARSGTGFSNSSLYTYTLRFTFSSVRKGTISKWVLGKLSTVNLSATNNDPATDYYYRYTGTQTPQSWSYDSAGNFDTNNTFVNECRSRIGSAPGNTKFEQVLVSSLSAANQQRYANWYAYYRTRVLMMRSAAGRAMFALDNRYRVGFSTINKGGNFNTDVTNTLGSFLGAADFGADQKVKFFSNLYGASPSGSTPLRRALAKVGQYYGKKFSNQVDPVQNACQRNYSILTTDGYWNETTLPTQLDGSTEIGNQDADINVTPRPQYDDSTNYSTTYVRTSYRQGSTNGCSNGRRKYIAYTEQQVTTVSPTGTTSTDWTLLNDNVSTTGCPSSQPNSTTAQTGSTGGPAPNTLADVAAYYYNTDLRTDLVDSVPFSDDDPNRKQHMTTYTLGLGLSGRLQYDINYLSGASADFNAIKAGTMKWPIPPLDTSSDPAKIDDLWHAAVNGHGRYFSASSSDALVSALDKTLKSINARDGAGASAASTSLRPVFGTDQVFIASYRTQDWNGELEARTIKINQATDTVSVGKENSNWKASALLNGGVYSDRNIYYARKTTSGTGTVQALGRFTYTNLSSDVDSSLLTGHFNGYCSKSPRPTQCSALTTAQQTNASGANLVNFVRGDRSNEGTLYRTRVSVLGDMVDASPVYVGKPPFEYTNNDYPTYKTSKASRCPVVYAAANDGMLHAFSAKSATTTSTGDCPDAGTEMWAYVPRAVMPNLYMLGDSDYANLHRFSVNATPVVADIHRVVEGENVWRTMLVGGLGAGGKSYYALDVSSPSSPALMWEFTDADLGLSYGNPIVTQLPDGNGGKVWAVVFTSGLNNSGNGYLYVLNAHTGAIMHKVPTLVNNQAVGSSDTPSGLAKLNAWISTPSDNEAMRFYAGDLLGNLWRFDANNLAAPTGTTADTRAVRLAQFVKNNIAQPITVKPELAEVRYGGYNYPVVLVGTGRYLGGSDAMDTTTPASVYAVKDPLTSTGWSNVRDSMVAQTLSTSGDNRTVTKNAVDWSSSTVAGWYVDLPDPGERVAVGMSLAYTTLTVASIVPATDVCSGSGYSWIYDLDIATGSYVLERASTQQGGYKRPVATMGINTLQFEGRSKSGQIITNADGSIEVRDHVKAPTSTGTMRRTSWRELTQ